MMTAIPAQRKNERCAGKQYSKNRPLLQVTIQGGAAVRKLSGTEKWMIVLTALFSAAMIVLYLRMTGDDGNAVYRITTERGGMTIGEYESMPVDINTADLARLMTLEGIGPELAERIIAYREAHGGFTNTEELMEVEGIGEGKYAKLIGHIVCGEVQR